MRIAHVVTYLSDDGAFGGPTRVAEAQAKALAKRGHEVVIFCASPVAKPTRYVRDDVTYQLFPARYVSRRLGFAGMYAPGLARAVGEFARAADITHVHLARDLVTLAAARVLGRMRAPYITQSHGMIDRSSRFIARPVDAVATKPAIGASRNVLTLSDDEQAEIQQIAPGARLTAIRNGVEIFDQRDHAGRRDEVLFLARLHERKRPRAFVDAAEVVGRKHPNVKFVVAGPDEGEGEHVRQRIASSPLGDRIRWEGPIAPSATDQAISRARAYVLPSFGEVFPMTVLEAFRVGTPVVVTDQLAIANDIARYGAGIVTDGSPAQLADAIGSILADPEFALRLADGAQTYLRAELDIDDVATHLERIYTDATKSHV